MTFDQTNLMIEALHAIANELTLANDLAISAIPGESISAVNIRDQWNALAAETRKGRNDAP